jgi:uncharacterized protein
MMQEGMLKMIANILVLVGGINWGLIGLGDINIVGLIFGGGMSLLSRLVYILVGVSAAYLVYLKYVKKDKAM